MILSSLIPLDFYNLNHVDRNKAWATNFVRRAGLLDASGDSSSHQGSTSQYSQPGHGRAGGHAALSVLHSLSHVSGAVDKSQQFSENGWEL